MEIKSLQEQLADAELKLKQERDRADLLATEIQRLRLAASSGHTSPATFPSSPCGAAPTSPASPQNNQTTRFDPSLPHPNSSSTINLPNDTPDMVLVPRATLEMLYLKERAMDAVKEGITIADAQAPDMPLVYVNQGFARLTGYPVEAFSLGKNCRFLQGPGTEEEEVQRLSQAIKSGNAIVVQITNYKRSGDPFLNYLSLTPVHDPGSGILTHYVGIQADITELVLRRKAELAAKHAKHQAEAATEAKSQFLARMSHEIRTPLNGMIAVGQLLADTKLTAAQWDLVNTIRCSGEALLTLITDILDFSKIEANKMVLSSVPFSLESTIEAAMEIAGLHAARKRLQAAYHVAPGVPAWVVGDAQRLQQVLLNILNNALKFTEAGEVLLEVWVQPIGSRSVSQELALHLALPSASSLSSTDATSSSSTSNNIITSASTDRSKNTTTTAAIESEKKEEEEYEIHFSVRDTGIGISKPDLIRLFQSFSQVDASPTRRFGGSGLGLAISQKLSEAMGGKMWAESAGLGRGSAFRWCIKTKKASASAISAAKLNRNGGWGRRSSVDGAAAPGDGGGSSSNNNTTNKKSIVQNKKVLLVEPCDMVRQVMLLALRQWGCDVCAVDSECAAIAKLQLRPGQTTPEEAASRVMSAAKSRLSLVKAAGVELRDALAASAACNGPFDVVVLDVNHSAVLHALMESCTATEAQKVVFLGWPGQGNPEDDEENQYTLTEDEQQLQQQLETSTSVELSQQGGQLENNSRSRSLPKEAAPPAYASGQLEPIQAVALPPKILTEAQSIGAAPPAAAGGAHGGALSGNDRRQLGYVVVSRPVRQGRLRLGLEEVLEMEIVDHYKISSASLPTSPTATAVALDITRKEGDDDLHAQNNEGGHLSHRNHNTSSSTAVVQTLITTTTTPTTMTTTTASPVNTTTGSYHSRSEAEHTHSESGTGSPLKRSTLGNSSSNSLLQAAPMKRISSGSSLATADGGGLLGGTTLLDNSSRKLLIAEDNAINMKVALGILRRLGFTNIVTAPDGVAAVEAVAAAGGPAAFDAILMDLHMPRKGGIEAVQDILRAWPNQKTKIIAVTADAFEDTRDSCIANGFSGWLAKPFRVEEFARIMGEERQLEICRANS